MNDCDLQRLLFSFYERSFLRVLGVSLSLEAAQRCRGIREVLAASRMPTSVRDIEQRVFEYQANVSPRVKLEALVSRVTSTKPVIANVLDFGCGDGASLRYLKSVLQGLTLCWGIDSDISVLPPTVKSDGILQRWGARLDEVTPTAEFFDLITAVHVLHHNPACEQHDLIRRLGRLLRRGGIFYLMEDSWTASCSSGEIGRAHV